LSLFRSKPPQIPLADRRVLALGDDLARRAQAALPGQTVKAAGERLDRAKPGAADLILIDADALGAEALALTMKAIKALADPPPVLLVGATLPVGLVRDVLRLPVSDILEAPFEDARLAAMAQELLSEAARSEGAATASGSRCWGVSGAVGGAGATTLAIEIAHTLAQRATRERSVCLVDLNLADGAAAAYLGAKPTTRLADFGGAAERIDASMLQAFVTPVSRGLDLIAGVRDAAAFETVGREAILRMLEVACEGYDHVILDLPRHRRPWTLEALAGCDEVLVVSALDGALKPRIVLNRLASRMFGSAPSMTEAEKALQRKADAGVSSDWEAAAASVNLGGPIAQHRPKSKIVKDVEALVDRLAAQAPRRDTAMKVA
jgi:pilus assembly protein CpaE